ncbi:DUF4178 domain-containing protein [Paenibacillus thalictri]|uniref:DUF4178 domain-containing protein n=1 Tax=Paenibacillus thalictri TaxID=2527873 RepID=A0A4Q9DZM5_9BACL|nr:DUF4178 domain-containing protein [Paenibacillus thalictri]TBL81303.1 DUF4178 domain-containing protein [Paenibacillus thalictri]
MSIFKRVGSILKSNKQPDQPVKTTNSFEETNLGDILIIDLEEYVVSGKVVYFDRGFAPHRFAYYLQNGKHISCLLIEKGRTYECFMLEFVEGSLDDPNDVPTRLEVGDNLVYELEHYRTDMARTEGNTDFRNNDDLLIWRYFADQDRYFFLQWQDGKYVALEGAKIPSGLIQFMKSK